MADPSPRAALAIQLFAALEAGRVRFCAVGDTGTLPDCIDGDIDIVIGEADTAKLPQLVFDLARRHGAELVQIFPHEHRAWYFIIAGFTVGGTPWFVHPDISCGYLRDARPLLDAAQLLADCRPALATDGVAKGFAVPAPANEFIYYLIKKTEKLDLGEDQARHLSQVYSEDPIGAGDQVRRFWNPADADQIIAAAGGGDWAEIRGILPRLRRDLHAAKPIPWAARWREILRVIGRIRRPTGVWVVLLGPDGSGKSTILGRISADLAPAFRATRRFHLRASSAANRPAPPVTDPHARSSRGAFASAAWLAVNLPRCWLGYWLRVWPALVRSTLVGFDRYHHDLLVDPRRYRYGGPRWLARLSCACVPHPDLWILLDASPAAIATRKSELPPSEIERQRRAFRELAAGLRDAHIVDASCPVDEVARAVERIVIGFLAARSARRWRLRPG